MQEAEEEKHISSLVHKCPKLLQDDAPAAIDYLECDCSEVRYDQVSQKEAEVLAMA